MGEAAAVSGDAGARARVRVLAVSRVAPSPAPVEREPFGLSFFNTPWGRAPADPARVPAKRLGGGAGLALGLSVHHAVADGRAVWQFMEAWSSAARVGSPVTKSLGAPHYRREAAIPQPDGGELARHMLKLVAPKLPAVASGDQQDFSQRFRLARRTFHLGADAIRALKRRIDELASAEEAADGGGAAKPAAVAEMEAAPLAGTADGSAIARVMQIPFSRMANVAASPRFGAYGAADFGFGRPARVELVSMNHDGEMVLVGGRRDGEVQLSVSIDPAHVDAFKAQVLG
ncbi:hypothetical protein OsJ_26218 [Oryza sativa Japonica Group]|uniref:Uncharacterized protein n=1 Tax=Oryza sativa subsp. japonica TaxID=39947 RepID=B9FZB1_ORYSJ|nr:hypothetical protein OsJ_26218 [Oryza sativa Japonica Group]